jgi:trigger factor
MQVSVETTGALERRMTVKVPAQRVEDEIDSRLKSLLPRARVKGFRPGKVPLKVVQQSYGPQVRDEVVSELLRQTLGEALAQHKLNPAGGPRIEQAQAEPGRDLEYTAVFEVYPEVKLAPLDALKVERPKAEVSEADVDRMVDNLRRQRGTWKAAARAAQDGDRITIDFVGSLDGKPFAGGRGERVPVVIGSGRMVPGFEPELVGLAAGASKRFELRFPSDYPAADLAGKQVAFDITTHQVDELEMPTIDDAFCRAFGVAEGGVAKLRSEVADNMRRELETAIRRQVKDQLLEGLVAANDVPLPKALVDEEIARLQHDALRRMGLMDRTRQPDLPREMFEPQAQRRVKLGLLVGELLRSQRIRPDEARLTKMLDELAAEHPDRERARQAYRADPEVMRQIETLTLEEQAVDFLLAQAKVTDRTTTFAELMRFGEQA